MRLEDIELRRNDEVFMNALGAERIPDPTTAGDFTRRFEREDIETWDGVASFIVIGSVYFTLTDHNKRSKNPEDGTWQNGETVTISISRTLNITCQASILRLHPEEANYHPQSEINQFTIPIETVILSHPGTYGGYCVDEATSGFRLCQSGKSVM